MTSPPPDDGRPPDPWAGRSMRPPDPWAAPAPRPARAGAATPFLALAAAAALLGAVFAAVATSDFIRHLDRQVHSIHCSFIPGAGAEIGESGCRTVMLSPYSSVFRDALWGGLPISLLALAVFAYLTMHLARTLLSANPFTTGDGLYLLLATALPLVMSAVYAYVAVSRVGAVCKLCVGIYVSSGVLFLAAALATARAAPSPSGAAAPFGRHARWFAEGVAYVGLLSVAYVLFAPISPKPVTGCGTLVKRGEDDIMIPLPTARGGTPAIVVLDPLCPACKGFDERMRASDLYAALQVRAVLFPLDSACNWMVKESLHPGACAVSEAMLCATDAAGEILDWAFAHQEELRTTAGQSDAAVRQRIAQQFPQVQGCLGSGAIKNRVNKSLRWAVANALPVLTPQLFIGDRRVCDEDTDLGLEYTIASMTRATGS
ncbi:MAG: vitamin K epoxide reductase family protein [Candidatus Binatia bacterium]